jgi:antitoxin HigA-1
MMIKKESTVIENYNPGYMFDTLIARMQLKNDEELAQKLKVAKPVVTLMREGKLSISASMLIWLHEASGISLQELRTLLKDKRAKHRMDLYISKAKQRFLKPGKRLL